MRVSHMQTLRQYAAVFVLDKAMKSRSVAKQAEGRTESFHRADGTPMQL